MLRSVLVSMAVVAAFVSGHTATAEVTFDWATVGNPGNAPDPLNSGNIPGIGSVAYEYRIAKHEVTNDQYVECLNAVAKTDTKGLYNAFMGTDPRGGITQSGASGSFTYSVRANMGNKPVSLVSFLDAMRFVNWLHNGQPTGAQDSSTTEDGVYAISDGVSETRASNAQFFIPTENEWYKAAHHDPTTGAGGGDNYWLYPTRSDSAPTSATASDNGDNFDGDISNPGINIVNYNRGADWNGQDGNVTTVGSAGVLSESFYGTSGQGGNVREWNETLVSAVFRIIRAGSWESFASSMQSTARFSPVPTGEAPNVGFRVASPIGPIPTVSTWGMAALVLLVIVAGSIVFRPVRVVA